MKKIAVSILCAFWLVMGVITFAKQSSPAANDTSINEKQDQATQEPSSKQTIKFNQVTTYNGFDNSQNTSEPQEANSSANPSELQASSGSANRQELPAFVVMDELIFHVNFLEERIFDKEQNGQNAKGLKAYYKRQARLTDAEDQAFKRTVKDITNDLKAVDNRIKAVVQAYRAKVANGIPAGKKPPEIPSELHTLKSERENILLSGQERLRTSMGNAGFERLLLFVHREITPKIRVITSVNQTGNSGGVPTAPDQP